MTTCSVDGCERSPAGRGLCLKDYKRMQRHGQLPEKVTLSVAERFWAKVVHRDDGCMTWTGELDADGYGRFTGEVRREMAHRWSYEQAVGPIPDGLHLDHLCRVRECVNPRHLEPVTPRENVLRSSGLPAVNAAKTHCLRGHPFDAANTLVKRGGQRSCRQCERMRKGRA